MNLLTLVCFHLAGLNSIELPSFEIPLELASNVATFDAPSFEVPTLDSPPCFLSSRWVGRDRAKEFTFDIPHQPAIVSNMPVIEPRDDIEHQLKIAEPVPDVDYALIIQEPKIVSSERNQGPNQAR